MDLGWTVGSSVTVGSSRAVASSVRRLEPPGGSNGWSPGWSPSNHFFSQKKKWENLPKQREGEEGEEGEEGSSRMRLETQNLRTPSTSDAVTDATSSGNGRLVPHALHGNTRHRRGSDMCMVAGATTGKTTFMTTTLQDRRNRKIMRVLQQALLSSFFLGID
jgi:hypothetical protein